MAAVEDKVEFRAKARWVRTAPRKAQLVVEEIRGRTVPEAQVILSFMTRAAAKDVANVLNSAVANAESHPLSAYSGEDLYVAAAEVGTGPTLKRWRARARGRVGRIKKRTCHITIRLEPTEGAVAVPPPSEPRPARSRKPKAEAPAPAAEEATATATADEDVPAPVEAEPEAPAEAEGEPVEDAAEESPAAEAVEEPAAEAVEEPAAEAVEEPPADEAPEEQPKPKPRASRARKKKTDEPAPESPAGEES
jgi:large subunit ribosomal protein L22